MFPDAIICNAMRELIYCGKGRKFSLRFLGRFGRITVYIHSFRTRSFRYLHLLSQQQKHQQRRRVWFVKIQNVNQPHTYIYIHLFAHNVLLLSCVMRTVNARATCFGVYVFHLTGVDRRRPPPSSSHVWLRRFNMCVSSYIVTVIRAI